MLHAVGRDLEVAKHALAGHLGSRQHLLHCGGLRRGKGESRGLNRALSFLNVKTNRAALQLALQMLQPVKVAGIQLLRSRLCRKVNFGVRLMPGGQSKSTHHPAPHPCPPTCRSPATASGRKPSSSRAMRRVVSTAVGSDMFCCWLPSSISLWGGQRAGAGERD